MTTFEQACQDAVERVVGRGLDPEPYAGSDVFDRVDVEVDRRARAVYSVTCYAGGAWAATISVVGGIGVVYRTCTGFESRSRSLAEAFFACEADVQEWLTVRVA